MFWKLLVIVSIFSTCVTGSAFSAECGSQSAKELNLYPGSTGSIPSPDQLWDFISVGAKSSERGAALYIRDAQSSKKWNIGWIERSGTAFWSDDSKRLFLRDEYAADDTKIRVFDLTGAAPKEIEGVDREIRRTIFTHIPPNETTQCLYYPKVCFAANDSSTIIVIADAPLVPKKESGSGKPFRLRLTVNLNPLEIVDSALPGNPPKPTDQQSPRAVATPDWHKVDGGPFSILAPSGWEFHQLQGVDSYVGEFVGDGVVLRFDFGGYASGYLKEAKKPTYVIAHEHIGGYPAKIASPRIPGHGVTGVYFRNVGHSNGLCVWGKDLTSTQQELVLKIFETLRFGGPVPRYVLPPPPIKNVG